MPQKNKVVIIGGPTASGKSALAMDIALACNGVVINADSMQLYKGVPIITACPTAEDKAKVPHKLYEIYEPSYNGTVVEWLNNAVREIKLCWQQGKLPVVVGGTGFYLDNLINGTTPIPETETAIREKVKNLREEIGQEGLYEKLRAADPETAARLAVFDTHRVGRAYEVFLQTGIPLSVWHKKPMNHSLPEADFVVLKLCPDAQSLDERCFLRFDRMMQEGALAEVVHLAEQKLARNLPVMKALGVPELLTFVDGKASLEEAVALGKLHTRQYAKRQRTWFKGKLAADICLDACYDGKNFSINDVKKRL